MQTIETPLVFAHAPRARIHRIDGADLNWALAQGWKDFKENRIDLIFVALIYPIVGLAAAAYAFKAPMLPLVFPLLGGITLLGPAVACGFCELGRRRDAGIEASWIHIIDPLRGRSRMPLILLTVMLAVLFVGWIWTAAAIYSQTLGAAYSPTTLREFISLLFSTPEGWALIVVGNLAGFMFAVIALVASVVSFPLIIDKPVSAGTAVMTSLRACVRNPMAMASWGVRVVVLLALGCLPFFMGLAVVLPVLGYATWRLYTSLVER